MVGLLSNFQNGHRFANIFLRGVPCGGGRFTCFVLLVRLLGGWLATILRPSEPCAGRGLIRTLLTPGSTIPSLRAAPCERSIARPRIKGPRSVIRTCTDLPLVRLVTSTRVPSGSVGWAAVRAF